MCESLRAYAQPAKEVILSCLYEDNLVICIFTHLAPRKEYSRARDWVIMNYFIHK